MVDLFSTDPAGFVWATGIEDTFIADVKPGLRRMDEYELTQHYQLWQTDFELLSETGVRAVRWGIPWYRVQPRPDQWDWSWVDAALDDLVNNRGIVPILDLMHYGTPLWLDNSFINASFAARMAEYTAAVAERYGSLVRYYTPYNEPMVSVEWSGFRGRWPPYLEGYDGYVKMTMAVARGLVASVRALKSVQPDAVTVQVEALWRFRSDKPDIAQQVAERNEAQYLAMDLTTGRVDEGHLLYPLLRGHGVTDAELAWFRENAVRYDYLGANFYPWSYGKVTVRKEGLLNRLSRNINGMVIAEVLGDAYARYGIPMLVTETSARRNVEGRARWMDETIEAVRDLRREGVPVVGYTWFPFFSMFSWYYRRGRHRLRNYLLHLGLFEADFDAQGVFVRQRTPLVDRYQHHMATPMPPVM